MGQAVSNFFTTTVVNVAKNAWATVVHGVTVFSKWLEAGVQSLVTTVVSSIKDMRESLKKFIINCWDSVEAFTNKIFNLKPSPKDYVWDNINKIGKGLQSASVRHMRTRLKELGYEGIESLSDEKVQEKWDEYMKKNPLSEEDKKDLDDTFSSDKNVVQATNQISCTGGYSKFMSHPVTGPGDTFSSGLNFVPSNLVSYRGGYSNFMSRPDTGPGATSPEEFKLRKDHVITHVSLVLLSPKELSKGLRKSVSLAPHEEQELDGILST